MKKDASFWSDIKSLDERLKRDPDSFCFARLSEIYLKVGLVSDALHTARAGVARHPGYLAGQRSLGLACNAAGLRDEACSILERVTAAIPEDVEAQKVLAELYVASGNRAAAVRSYSLVMEFMPDDRVAASRLEALEQAADEDFRPLPALQPVAAVRASDDDDIIELSESDIYEDETGEMEASGLPVMGIAPSSESHDPLSTLTLAELYEKQGFASKALDIYRSLLADDPDNQKLRDKVAVLEGGEVAPETVVEEDEFDGLEEELVVAESEESVAELLAVEAVEAEFVAPAEEPAVCEIEEPVVPPVTEEAVEQVPVAEEQLFEPVADIVAESFEPPETTESVAPEPVAVLQNIIEPVVSAVDPVPFAPFANKAADNAVESLESLLENIRRIKACR